MAELNDHAQKSPRRSHAVRLGRQTNSVRSSCEVSCTSEDPRLRPRRAVWHSNAVRLPRVGLRCAAPPLESKAPPGGRHECRRGFDFRYLSLHEPKKRQDFGVQGLPRLVDGPKLTRARPEDRGRQRGVVVCSVQVQRYSLSIHVHGPTPLRVVSSPHELRMGRPIFSSHM